MTRPAADPLRAIAPDALAYDVAFRVSERAASLTRMTGDGDLGGCSLAEAVLVLVAYAQTGEGGARVDDALYTADWCVRGQPLPDGYDLALVLDAARCRLAIERHRAVGLAPLAALAGVSLRTVRADLASGALVATPASRGREREVTAMQARRWLAARGVPGYVAS